MGCATTVLDRRSGPPERDGDAARAALGSLINLSGKQRMLSHRTVMFLGLSCSTGSVELRQHLLRSAADALAEFRRNSRILVDGDPSVGLPPLFSPAVAELLSGPTAYQALLERFADQAEACQTRLERGDAAQRGLVDLAELVAGELLAALNRIARAYEQDLAAAIAAEKARTDEARRMAVSTLTEIESLGLRVKLIAFNALIEAARAGDAGRSFAVIAQEIKALSEQTQAAASDVGRALNALTGAAEN